MGFFKITSLILSLGLWGVQALHAMEDLDQQMRSLTFTEPSFTNITREGLNSNPHTHTPRKGNNLYITEEARISFQTKAGQKSLRIVPSSVKDLAVPLNHSLYFNHGLGGRSNHLFVSLGVTYKVAGETKMKRRLCPLTWSPETQQFAFSPSTQVTFPLCYVDFYNHANEDWKEQPSREVVGKKVKLVFHSCDGIPGVVASNINHSEPKALGLLSAHKNLIVNAINDLPDQSKIKIIQLFFHSFLDFCVDCESMISKFQRDFRESLLPYLQTHLFPHRYLFSKKKPKVDRLIFMITGVNNRLYKLKPYFYNQDLNEKTHSYAGYFLESYQPYTGKLLWEQVPNQNTRLVTYINEPIGQGIKMDSPFGDLSLMMPLNQATLYWRLTAHHLYWNLEDFKQMVSPDLVMIDLKDARLGIREDEDDGDCYAASQGNEVKEALEAIQVCQGLKYLNLSENWITSRTLTSSSLPPLFNPFQQLIYLNLSSCCLQSQKAAEVASQILTFLPRLEHLDLSHNSLNADVFFNLQSGLSKLLKPITLNLSHNRLAHGCDFEADYKGSEEADTVEALSWIVDYIQGTPSLLRVNLTSNDFDGISFSWSEIRDETGLERTTLNTVRAKLRLEKGAGIEDSDSEESSSEEENESE